MSPKSASKALALIGTDAVAEWRPTIQATAEDANLLTQSVVTLAFHDIEAEREAGSEIPPTHVPCVDPETGEMTQAANPSFEAVVEERALCYLQSMALTVPASLLEIIADFNERQLYMHHPDAWGTLSQFLRSMSVGKSNSYHSIVERLVTVILPFLQVKGLASVREIMELVTEGGFSNLYFVLPNMLAAVEAENGELLAEILSDAKSLSRSEILPKYRGGKMRVKAAGAMLTHTNPGWQLVITMNEAQKRVILNRLGGRIEYE